MIINANMLKRLSMPRHMPKKLIIYKLKQRFLMLNNYSMLTMKEVDWESLDDTLEYWESLDDFEDKYPQFNWRTNKEELNRMRDRAEKAGRNLDDLFSSIRVELKLYLQRSPKGDEYAYIKGTIPKKLYKKFKARILKSWWIEWLLHEPYKKRGK